MPLKSNALKLLILKKCVTLPYLNPFYCLELLERKLNCHLKNNLLSFQINYNTDIFKIDMLIQGIFYIQ